MLNVLFWIFFGIFLFCTLMCSAFLELYAWSEHADEIFLGFAISAIGCFIGAAVVCFVEIF